MCHLITIGTGESREAIIDLLGPDSRIEVHPSNNPSVRAIFPQQDRLFELKSGPCSCALVARKSANSFDDQLRRRTERYRKEGWSDAKIARALAAARIAHRSAMEKYSAPELAISTLLGHLARRPGGARMLIHFYSGSFDAEVVTSAPVVDLAAEQLQNPDVVAEDQLFEIAPSPD